jgi:hypothetical protein
MATTPEVTKEELAASAEHVNLPPELQAVVAAADTELPTGMSAADKKRHATKVTVWPMSPVVGLMADMATGLSDADFEHVASQNVADGLAAGLLTGPQAEAALQRITTLAEAKIDPTVLARIKAL